MNRAIEMMGLAKEYSGKRVIDDLSQGCRKGRDILKPVALGIEDGLVSPAAHSLQHVPAGGCAGDSFPWWSLLALSAFLLAFSLGSMAVLRRLSVL